MTSIIHIAYFARPRSNTYPQACRQPSHRRKASQQQRKASHPAGRMPRDIWEEIFIHCLPTLPDPDSPSYNRQPELLNHLSAPLLLTQVCKSWRKVALSLPDLWTSLSVVVRSGRAFPSLEVASNWLKRTGGLPLALSLYQTNESEGNQEVADDILALYMRYMTRWRDVRLDIANPTYGRSLQPINLYVPLLETFHLTTCWRLTPNEEIMQDLLKMLEMAPLLSSFSVSRLSDLNVSPTSTVAIPWTQLTRLDLGFIPSVSACLSIMSGCPNLTSCNLIIDPQEGPLPSISIVLPALTSLELHTRDEELAALLDLSVFPTLKQMTLFVHDGLDDRGLWPQASFLDFFTRSKCTLSRLELHDTGMQPEQFVECLSHESVRGISELVMHDGRDWTWDPIITPRLLQLMTVPQDKLAKEGCFLPALKALELGKGCWACPNGSLSTMVESRWRTKAYGVARLERLKLDLHLLEDAYGYDHMRLETLRAEGLKVRLSYYHD
ncbi:hypothetical protein C8J57DRAFT_597090 [Mycena rebaudengoi]|nr:hypothetical protein C8J57DRAFT_597090 [Mycena rebaudengoi]